MTKQTARGTGGPDDIERTHEAVVRLRREAITQRMAPIAITFSPEGHTRAEADTVPGMTPWGRFEYYPEDMTSRPTTYLGLPFDVVQTQVESVLLTLVPGGSPEAREARAAQREAPGVGHGAHQARARMLLEDADTLRLMAAQATKEQVFEFLRLWGEAHPGEAQVVTSPRLSGGLDNAAVREHGRSG